MSKLGRRHPLVVGWKSKTTLYALCQPKPICTTKQSVAFNLHKHYFLSNKNEPIKNPWLHKAHAVNHVIQMKGRAHNSTTTMRVF